MASISPSKSRLPFFNTQFIQKLPNLFFFRRHPFKDVPKQWVRPASDETYNKLLEFEGFVTLEHWKEDNLSDYPLIVRDLNEVDEHLLPTFWDFNQKAKHFQNNFYFYQWVFIIGAFLTTVAAVITAYFQAGPVIPDLYVPVAVYEQVIGTVPQQTTSEDPTSPPATSSGDELIRVNLDQLTPLQREQIIALANIEQETFNLGRSIGSVMGWVTLVISLLTTYSATMTNYGEPRKKWNNYRRLTEELRMTYYKYLSHLEPFDKDDRLDVLRRRVLEIRRKEQDNNG